MYAPTRCADKTMCGDGDYLEILTLVKNKGSGLASITHQLVSISLVFEQCKHGRMLKVLAPAIKFVTALVRAAEFLEYCCTSSARDHAKIVVLEYDTSTCLD